MGNTPQKDQPTTPTSTEEPKSSLKAGEAVTISLAPGYNVTISLVAFEITQGVKQSCWCYVTDGLRAFGQQELIVLLLHEPEKEGMSYPPDILTYLKLVLQCAHQKMYVHDGGYTQLGGTFLGHPDNAGFVYTAYRSQVPASALPVKDPAAYLYAVLAKKAEIEWAKYMGHRLLLKLGHHHKFFPCPLWGQRTRPAVLGGVAQSVITRTPMVSIEGLLIQREDDVIQIRIPMDKHDEFISDISQLNTTEGKLTDLSALTLLGCVNSDADSHLVFVPGSNQPSAIGATGSPMHRLGGSFVTLLPVDDTSDPVTLIEDGWMIKLKPAKYWELVAAMKKQESFTLSDSSPTTTTPTTTTPTTAAQGNTTTIIFKIEWYQRKFTNPVTGETLFATSGWTAHHPSGDSEETTKEKETPIGGIALKSITLLTEDSVMGRRISANVLADFVKELCDHIEKIHMTWMDTKQKEGNKKEEEKEKEEEGKEEKPEKVVPRVLSAEQELVIQVEITPSGQVTFKGTVGNGDETLTIQVKEWEQYLMNTLHEDFLAKKEEEEEEEGKQRVVVPIIPAVTEGPIAFLLYFHQA